MANLITISRIAFSLALFFPPVFSAEFQALYLLAGFSDILDGPVARRTGTVSELGSKLDTIADICFAAAAFIRIVPLINIPVGFLIWTIIIAGIKAASISIALVNSGKLLSVHSFLNRLTGVLLFIFPMTVGRFSMNYSLAAVCSTATAAAIQEFLISLKCCKDKTPAED